MTDKIIGAAKRYNSIIAGFVESHNAQYDLGDSLHIHDLRTTDLQALQREGYGVQTVPIPMTGDLRDLQIRDPYAGYKAQVDKVLSGQGKDFCYIPIEGEIRNNPGLLELVGDEAAQRGICVVRRRTDAHEFEVHRYGNEGVRPIFFDCITLITKGYDAQRNAIDRSTARMVYMPTEHTYVFDTAVGHFFPHVVAFTEVFLPDGTGAEGLEPMEIMVNNTGKKYVSRNVLLASDRAKDGTTVEVIGKTSTTEIISALQEGVDEAIGPELEELVRA